MPHSVLTCLRIMITAALLAAASPAGAGLESPWLDGYNTRSRLLAGVAGAGEQRRLVAFVEIELPPGWKTYWRTPGDAGGLPPTFDWSKSANLASATMLFPAPKLMTDKSGNTIGYKERVVFPVEIKAKDADKAIGLALSLHYGICKDICVPVDAELTLDIPPGAADAPPAAALEALDHVPRGEGERRSGDPVLKRAESKLDGEAPALILEASFPGDAGAAAIFLEAPEGLYLPVPQKKRDDGADLVTFEAPLGQDVDLAALKGKTITATLVGKSGASVSSFRIE